LPVDSLSADTGDFNSLSTDQLTFSSTSSVGAPLSITGNSRLLTAESFNLDDDESQVIKPDVFPGDALIVWVSNDTNNETGIFAASGASLTEIVQAGTEWATSDTDAKNCLFRNGEFDLVIKNRVGASRNYSMFMLAIEQ
jgi:hypothetical protein